MPNGTPVQPKLPDLMARYLDQQTAAHGAGLALFDSSGEVVPFEAGPVQPVDPRPAWEEAIAAITFCVQKITRDSLQAPSDWPQLVAAQEPAVALAFCLGNYPQLLRDLQVIFHKADLTELRPRPGKPLAFSGLDSWANQVAAKKQYPAMLFAVGALRLANQFDRAADYWQQHDHAIPDVWRSAWANEKAALAWHSGRADEALRQWQNQEPIVPVLFNRGMAALFLGQSAEAKAPLAEAVAQLPETGAWHHLGRLYLALAARKE